jgi:hypothetical protein
MPWYEFLSLLAMLVERRKENGAADVAKLLHLGAAAGKAGAAGKEALEAAVAKVKQLVAEDRGLTDEENAALDASIEDKLARAAAVDLGAAE